MTNLQTEIAEFLNREKAIKKAKGHNSEARACVYIAEIISAKFAGFDFAIHEDGRGRLTGNKELTGVSWVEIGGSLAVAPHHPFGSQSFRGLMDFIILDGLPSAKEQETLGVTGEIIKAISTKNAHDYVVDLSDKDLVLEP